MTRKYMMENIEKLIKEFGEENRVLIENKLEIIVFKIDEIRSDNNKTRIKIEELDKRMYKVENHPSQCVLSEKILEMKTDIDEYLKEELPERMLKVENTLLAQASIKKWLIAAIAITGGLFTLLFSILKLLGML